MCLLIEGNVFVLSILLAFLQFVNVTLQKLTLFYLIHPIDTLRGVL